MMENAGALCFGCNPLAAAPSSPYLRRRKATSVRLSDLTDATAAPQRGGRAPRRPDDADGAPRRHRAGALGQDRLHHRADPQSRGRRPAAVLCRHGRGTHRARLPGAAARRPRGALRLRGAPGRAGERPAAVAREHAARQPAAPHRGIHAGHGAAARPRDRAAAHRHRRLSRRVAARPAAARASTSRDWSRRAVERRAGTATPRLPPRPGSSSSPRSMPTRPADEQVAPRGRRALHALPAGGARARPRRSPHRAPAASCCRATWRARRCSPSSRCRPRARPALPARQPGRHAGAPLRELQDARGQAVLPRPLRPPRPADRAGGRALRRQRRRAALPTWSARWRPCSPASSREPTPGSRGILPRRIDRLLFAATKADHLHHTSHDRLEAILRWLTDKAIARAALCRRGGEGDGAGRPQGHARGRGAHRASAAALPCIVGVPLPGERLGGRVFDGTHGGRRVSRRPAGGPGEPDDAAVPAAGIRTPACISCASGRRGSTLEAPLGRRAARCRTSASTGPSSSCWGTSSHEQPVTAAPAARVRPRRSQPGRGAGCAGCAGRRRRPMPRRRRRRRTRRAADAGRAGPARPALGRAAAGGARRRGGAGRRRHGSPASSPRRWRATTGSAGRRWRCCWSPPSPP